MHMFTHTNKNCTPIRNTQHTLHATHSILIYSQPIPTFVIYHPHPPLIPPTVFARSSPDVPTLLWLARGELRGLSRGRSAYGLVLPTRSIRSHTA
eukprot:691747-Amorphochlora_amoeboformis.AAC.1